MEQPIKVSYKSTSNPYFAIQWLRELPDLFAADFEVSIKYTPEQLQAYKEELENVQSKRRSNELKSILSATALDHPSHTCLTHFSCAWSESDAFVLVLDNDKIRNILLNFLVTTTKTQIWHNASFDFKHIYHYTGKFPLNYEDSQIRAKCILNHVETYKAKTGLKELAGHKYGSWGISSDNFNLSQIHDPKVIEYAAIDAASTFWLYHSIGAYIDKANSSQLTSDPQ